MSASIGMKKMLAFAVLGALGCLCAGGLGEGLLAGTGPAEGEKKTPSIASAPGPLAPAPGVSRAVAPARPASGPTAPPRPAGSPEMARLIKERKAGTGDIQISLRWENRNDIDLHCVDPSGEEIYFGHQKSRSGGWLEQDANNGNKEHEWGDTDRPLENVFWGEGKAPVGKYRVFIQHYSLRDPGKKDPTRYWVEIRVGSTLKKYEGEIAHKDGKKHIDEFTVT